jgi:hypothetical protein
MILCCKLYVSRIHSVFLAYGVVRMSCRYMQNQVFWTALGLWYGMICWYGPSLLPLNLDIAFAITYWYIKIMHASQYLLWLVLVCLRRLTLVLITSCPENLILPSNQVTIGLLHRTHYIFCTYNEAISWDYIALKIWFGMSEEIDISLNNNYLATIWVSKYETFH